MYKYLMFDICNKTFTIFFFFSSTDSFIDYQPMEYSRGERTYSNPTVSNINIRHRPNRYAQFTK